MDLSTEYLGLTLSNPLVPSASILSQEIDQIRKMEDFGASAVVLYSLFEEQLRQESLEAEHHTTAHTNSFSEATSFFPDMEDYNLGPEEYLEHIQKAVQAVDLPIIASLNGCSPGGWTEYAIEIEKAGAKALELNIYNLCTNPNQTSKEVEESYLAIIQAVIHSIQIPVTVKLSPFFTNLPHMAKKIEAVGAKGLVLFNRFFQPDIDLEKLLALSTIELTGDHEFRLPLRWIAILRDKIQMSLAATTGIYSIHHVLKILMVGADVTMLCSTLLKNGMEKIDDLKKGLIHWMEEHEYESIQQMKGSMSQKFCQNPQAFERAQYIKSLTSYTHKR